MPIAGPPVKSSDRLPTSPCWGALVMFPACRAIFARRSLAWLPSRKTWLKPVAKNVDFMPTSARFWQKMAEFGAILHKKGGLKMGGSSDEPLRRGGNTVSKSFRLNKHSLLITTTWLTTLVESTDRHRHVS